MSRKNVLIYFLISFCLMTGLFLIIILNMQLIKYQSKKDNTNSVMLDAVNFGDLHDLNTKIERAENHLLYLNKVKNKALISLQEIEKRIDSSLKKITTQEQGYEKSKKTLHELLKKITSSKLELSEVTHALSYVKTAGILSIGKPLKLKLTSSLKRIISDNMIQSSNHDRFRDCNYELCVDMSRCPLSVEFSVKLLQFQDHDYDEFLDKIPYIRKDGRKSCFHMVILTQGSISEPVEKIKEKLSHLPSWNNNGQNHMLIFPDIDDKTWACELLACMKHRVAIAIGQLHDCKSFNPHYDILMPDIKTATLDTEKRKSFQYINLIPESYQYLAVGILQSIDFTLYAKLFEDISKDINIFQFCSGGTEIDDKCIKEEHLSDLAVEAKFQIILNTKNGTLQLFYKQLFSALTARAIPMIIGWYHPLPLSKYIDWKLMTISIPLARITETYYYIKSIRRDEIFQLKRQGRQFIKVYFANTSTYFETILSFIRESIMILPNILSSYTPKKITTLSTYNSSIYTSFSIKSNLEMRNISRLTNEVYKAWNKFPGPHRLIPCTPDIGLWPTMGSYRQLGARYTPIVKADNGGSLPFGKTLAGNQPEEQFTVVILGYDRAVVMMDALTMLAGVAHLNKVVIVWNNIISPPPIELTWPDIGVPIQVVFPGKNSLNNRFLPFDAIETEAVLSLDDDMFLRPADIDFAFRVWRQHRDQLVGFPGRGISSDGAGNYTYDPTYSCQLSMILTGGAFFHKYYMYLYTYMIPPEIHHFVDENFNCEDIAMNFLIAYATQKEPIKVTSRWTFFCPGCSHSISRGTEHYEKRTTCINYFSKLFGYLPLVSTQFRADSVLFKTKLYGKGEKCYTSV